MRVILVEVRYRWMMTLIHIMRRVEVRIDSLLAPAVDRCNPLEVNIPVRSMYYKYLGS